MGRQYGSWRKLSLAWGTGALAIAAASGLVSCDRPSRPEPDAELASAVLRTYAEIAFAAYTDAAASARSLREQIAELLAAPSEERLARARAAWLAARVPYVQTEVYRFYDGPIDRVEMLVNSWPIDESYVEAEDPAAAKGLIQATEAHPELTSALLVSLNAADSETSVTTGYHVIEFLLWGRDTDADGPGRRSHLDFVASTEQPAAARRARYLTLAADLLVSHLEQVAAAWAPGGANYRAQMHAMPARDALGRVIKGMGALSGPELAGERLTVAYETKDQENEHSCFSDSTHLDMAGDALGIENVCRGRYRRGDGSSVSGPGLCALVASLDAGLGAQLERELAASVAAARAIPAPFDRAIQGSDEAPGRRAVASTIRALEAQTASLTRAATLLGADLGLGAARAAR